MGTSIDFLQWLQTDMSIKILTCLDNPSDLVRAASASRFWRYFVITNGFSKQLCLRMFPQFSSVAHVTELSCGTKKSVEVEPSNSMEWETLEKEHKVYSFLVRSLTTITVSDCIAGAFAASSTDNYPEESIFNTLDPRDRILLGASYWSSKGQSDPTIPETLIYKLRADLCVITEINIKPFEAFFQEGLPIYSAKSVRFQMGHPKFPWDNEDDLTDFLPLQQPADDNFIWTYTSQEFPMAQENRLQTFKLPKPVLCVGGFLQIELLGRVQRQEMDGLFYICVAYVEVKGQSLFPAFDIEILKPSGKFSLICYTENQNHTKTRFPDGGPRATFDGPASPTDMEQRDLLFNFFGSNLPVLPCEWDNEDNDLDDLLIF